MLGFTNKQKLASADYDPIFKQGKRFKTPCFSFLYLPKTELLPHLGLAISKKNVPSAVRRNLCKRLAREHFRLNQHIKPSLQMVVMANPPAAKASKEELHACFVQFWQQFQR